MNHQRKLVGCLCAFFITLGFTSQGKASRSIESSVSIPVLSFGSIDINAVTGPELSHVQQWTPEVFPENKKNYQTIRNFVMRFVWLQKEADLFKTEGAKRELYKGVRLDYSGVDNTCVVKNAFHPGFVTSGGDSSLDHFQEFCRQKDVCFVCDLWRLCVPQDDFPPSKDVLEALKRLIKLEVGKVESSKKKINATPAKLLNLLRSLAEKKFQPLEERFSELKRWIKEYEKKIHNPSSPMK